MNPKSILIPLLLSVICTLVVFWKIPFKGEVPFPGHLLVGRFFPWNTQGWEGYPSGVPYKEFISADTVRQTYPWRFEAIKQMKQGEYPGWNPYAFAGTPLAANLQSAPFYPLNILYWFSHFNLVWIVQVLLQPMLAFLFMFLFVRSLKQSVVASTLASLAFAFSGYMVVWLELNTVGHALLWLPLILWGIHKAQTNRVFFIFSTLGLVCSFFSGHIQSTVYIALVAIAYQVFLLLKHPSKQKNKITLYFSLSLVLALVLTVIQWYPAFFLFLQSPRASIQTDLFAQFLLPFKHLVTFIIPNFFGNPATNNFWGQDYGEFMAYFGEVALFFGMIPVFIKKRTKSEVFFIGVFVVTLLFALPTPLAYILPTLKIPVLSNAAAARILAITQFSGAVLAGFGLDYVIKRDKALFKVLGVIGGLYALVLLISMYGWSTAELPEWKTNWYVAIRNTAYPLAGVVFASCISVLYFYVKRLNKSIFWLIIPIALFGYTTFTNKYLPFSEPEFIFPEAVIFTELESRQSQERFFGDYTASVISNVWMPYGLYGVEGYDSLYLSRYGKLLETAKNEGAIPSSVPRSDANLEPNEDDFYRRRLQDLMGVSFILDKNDHPQAEWEPEPLRFDPKRYELIWQRGRFKIYKNLQALPRAYIVSSYEVITKEDEILDRLFSNEFNPGSTVLLETDPQIELGNLEDSNQVQITDYSPNQVTVKVMSSSPQLLVLSDVYDPFWTAEINGVKTNIYRANYVFRSVVVPAGESVVEFAYKPFQLAPISRFTLQ